MRIVTTGWRRSDDAIGAEVLPQLRGNLLAQQSKRLVPLQSAGIRLPRVYCTQERLAQTSTG
ncbi:MAG: hypothetical protein HY661_03860 [Betaproteobacteria bacterium]|nr:hypothetical protein [Betaproteobacteria bacterium]